MIALEAGKPSKWTIDRVLIRDGQKEVVSNLADLGKINFGYKDLSHWKDLVEYLSKN